MDTTFKQTNYCVLPVFFDADSVNNKDDKIIFTIKDTELYVPVVTLSAKAIKTS